MEPWYTLRITNLETVGMFSAMFRGWFSSSDANYNGFVRALLSGNLKEMNLFMNDVALATFSAFDTGKHPSARTQPERFYHGFVLGLLVELRGRYSVQSNKESGYGRYDICLIPQRLQIRRLYWNLRYTIQTRKNASRDSGISVKTDRRKSL